MFRAALVTTAKTWRQPPCPSTEEQIGWGTHVRWMCGLEKERRNAVCSSVDATADYFTKSSQSQREKQTSHSSTYV